MTPVWVQAPEAGPLQGERERGWQSPTPAQGGGGGREPALRGLGPSTWPPPPNTVPNVLQEATCAPPTGAPAMGSGPVRGREVC